jgi:putative toxin-antitoxin system antitoxin component (TIGR02293 family)
MKDKIEDVKMLAVTVFGDKTKAEEWLETPNTALNNCDPASRLETKEGVEEVILLLRKIETGEFS